MTDRRGLLAVGLGAVAAFAVVAALLVGQTRRTAAPAARPRSPPRSPRGGS